MKARYWMLFPKSVNKEMMRYDILWLKSQGYFKVKGKEVFGTIVKPSWWLEGIQDWIGRMNEKAMDLGDSLKSEIGYKLGFYVENVPNGELLREYTIRKMEKDLKHKVLKEKKSSKSKEQKTVQASQYEANYNKMAKDPDVIRALDKVYSITNVEGAREKITGHEISNRILDVYKNMNEKIFRIIEGKRDAILKYQSKDKKGNLEFFDK